MINELDELYRQVILDHFREPRNRGDIPDAQVKAEGSNPLCGDEISFSIFLDGDVIKQVRFMAKGCAISQAAGSMFSEAITGKTISYAALIIQAMKNIMQGNEYDQAVELGDLDSLVGVRKFPVRVKCAALSWNVVEQALSDHIKNLENKR